MIKKLIFDIDNTLIDWKEEYDKPIIENAYEKIGMQNSEEQTNKTLEAMDLYEKIYTRFNEKDINKEIEKAIGKPLKGDFIKEYLEGSIKIGTPSKIDDKEIKTLEYLSKKYELVVLTNWFTNSQTERLKKVDILKYFSKIYGTENIDMKPSKESFETARGKTPIEECIMIGDSIKTDIKGALEFGMKAIWYDRKVSNEIPECTRIEKFEELINIL